MRPRNLLILLIVTILLVALAYHRGMRERTPALHTARSGEAVFPELDINRIAMVTVTGNRATSTIHRAGGRWRIAEKYDYHADYQRLHDLLTRMADLTIGRPLWIDDTIRRKLLLLSPDAAGPGMPGGTYIEMTDPREEPLAAIIIGKPFHGEHDSRRNAASFQWRGADGRYIQTDAGEAYLVSETFPDLVTEPDEWIDRAFLDIPSDTLVTLTWVRAGRDPIHLVREQPDQPWNVRDAPDETKAPDTARIGEILSALRNLRFDDIADPSLTPDELGLTEPDTVTLTGVCADGRRYELLVGTSPVEMKPDVSPLRVSAGYDLPPDVLPPDGETPRNRAAMMHRHMETVRRLNERVDGWTYWISAERAQKIRVDQVEDLLQIDPNGES